ncbi:MAG: tetraether lipid synthase Tes [Methanosarcinales archaeon]
MVFSKASETKSLCPECLSLIKAYIYEENNKIIIEKKCKDHGIFKDIYWGDANLYKKFKNFAHDGDGLNNPITLDENGCPRDCGICPRHKTTTILANIDLTNRCNQRCPICFANAAVSGYLYEPTLEQIKNMLSILRNEQPVPCPAVQFSGGEPTMREDLVEIVKIAKVFGFPQIQLATNGIRLSRDLELCKKLFKAGLKTIYLQFDGVTKEPYEITRGYNALPVKLKAIENIRKSGIKSIALVPTLIKGVNDHQVGDIIKFTSKNIDVIKGVNFQPVSFAGRIDRKERELRRITIPDLLKLIEEQTDHQITREDLYPVPFVTPISHFISANKKEIQVEFTVHPHCGAGTYVFVDKGKFIPITRFIDVEGLMETLNEMANELTLKKIITNIEVPQAINKIMATGKFLKKIPSFVDVKKAPSNINVANLLINVLISGTAEATAEFHRNTMFIGVMHFQDLYNFDIERITRCGIHYATPDGRLIPFCTYNSIYRGEVEKKFSISYPELDV